MSRMEKDENVLLIIRGRYSSMTKAEKKVADYILENPKNVRFMSITDLADACHVGYTSVFRFCKTLKLHGYQDFRIRLSMSLMDGGDGESELLPAAITINDTIDTAAKKLMQSHINAITETNAMLDAKMLREATDYINQADQVRFFGLGGSHITAMEGMFKFLHIMPNVYCLSDTHMQIMGASTLNEKDVAIFVSQSGANKEIVEMAKKAKKGGAKTISITQHTNSPLAAYSDVLLLCGGYDSPLEGVSSCAKIAQLYVLDLLYTQVYRIRFDYSKSINFQVAESTIDKDY